MKIKKTIVIEPQVLTEVEWSTFDAKLDAGEAESMIAEKFDGVVRVEAFRVDGREFDHDNGQLEGTANVWFI